jgi:GNAT superfamily N-acetyltransferase
MNLEFKRFLREHYSEYASWFVDPELNRHLGPMDWDWLNAVLCESESAGVTWAVLRDSELVAVVETVFDPQNQFPAVISAVAVKPALRRQGIGTAVLQGVLLLDKSKGIVEHIAYVSFDNQAGQRCVERAGFTPITSLPDEHGYLEFRHHQEVPRS